jgi:subtilisin-like proprotein convertase family protein
MILVSPLGRACVVAGQIGAFKAVNVDVVLDDVYPNRWSGYTSGTFKPNTISNDFTMDAPCPAGPYSTTLYDAFGYITPSEANGTWKLYIQDLVGGDDGTMYSAELRLFELSPLVTPTVTKTITPTPSITPTLTPTIPLTPSITPSFTPTSTLPDYYTFVSSNLSTIQILDDAPASPYPVEINVSGLVTNSSRLTVQLTGINHPYLGDVAMILVSPTGTTCTLTGRVGYNPAVDATVSLDGTAIIPWDGISSGTFKPNTISNNFPMNTPCLAGPYNKLLSVFDNITPTDANGTWKVYIQDLEGVYGGDMVNITLRFHF